MKNRKVIFVTQLFRRRMTTEGVYWVLHAILRTRVWVTLRELLAGDHATSKHIIYYSQWYCVCECTRVCAGPFHYTDGLNLHQDTLSPFSVPQVMVGLSRIIQQCWLHEAQARLTSLRIKKSLANLRELLRDTKEPGQPWSTPSLQ